MTDISALFLGNILSIMVKKITATGIYSQLLLLHVVEFQSYLPSRGRHGRDRMVVGYTTTYVISAYHH